jgi:dipeptidyl aminopeptidase/acylaminoacyl peptidase
MSVSRWFVIIFALSVFAGAASAQDVDGPSFRDVIGLRSVDNPQIAPDGGAVIFEVEATQWEANRFDTELWIAPPGHDPRPLTNAAEGSSSQPRWSPDGRLVAFTSDRGEHTQLYILPMHGGEARQVTDGEDSVQQFHWAPDGQRIAFLRSNPEPDSIEQREEQYGDFAVEDQYTRRMHLWMVDVTDLLAPTFTADCDSVGAGCAPRPEPQRLTEGDTLTVTDFAWSPDGRRIAIEHKDTPAITAWNTFDIALLDVETRALTPLVDRPGSDGSPVWSPDGTSIFFETSGGEEVVFYKNTQYARIPVEGGTPTPLAEAFNEDLYDIHWTPKGLYATAWQKTTRPLVRIDPSTGDVRIVGTAPRIMGGLSFSADGTHVALVGQTASTLQEVYRTALEPFDLQPLTATSEQIANWPLGTSEVISWTSRDGAEIEGVLYKPADFDPLQTYPLLVNIHGGPAGIDYPQPFEAYVYPIAQWMMKDALVLQPNYRGSAGYGEAFRSLNVRDLGVGDMKDVMSGVDYLIDQGIVDTTRMGAMGWSQGGYISAFLATNTDRFAAISVGAGISDWETYYVTTDITPFTRQYLQANPWEDPAIYEVTSPMTTIQQARTPTLIQHGENDARVPIPNAYKLYQGLLDQDVETKLIIYQGFGHGITKPKERLAATWHNWQWFAKHLWGEHVALPLDP